MKNFIFISPNFPVTYWKFCAELKNNGMRVLRLIDDFIGHGGIHLFSVFKTIR